MSTSSDFIPPIALRGWDKLRKKIDPHADEPWSGKSPFFEAIASSAEVYGEYGVGASTEWVYRNTENLIVATETSPEWARKVLAGKDPSRIKIELVDVGDLKYWGFPENYRNRMNFRTYTTSIWSRGYSPDFVLIDGRFRVCCFFTSLLNAKPGTKILFDDYGDRPHYHIAAEFVAPLEMARNQALFEVPERLNVDELKELAGAFQYVLE